MYDKNKNIKIYINSKQEIASSVSTLVQAQSEIK